MGILTLCWDHIAASRMPTEEKWLKPIQNDLAAVSRRKKNPTQKNPNYFLQRFAVTMKYW